MIRDFKFLRRNPAKNANAEEVENVPPNSRDSANPQISTEPSRPPLNAIMEPPSIPKIIPDQEFTRPNKVDRTPTKPKPKPKHSDSSVPLRTPEKQGLMSRNRFNWAQKSDNQSNNGAAELKEEGRAASNGNTPNSRAVGRATLSYSECNSLQSTPCKSVSKPPNPGYSVPSGSRTVCNMSARMAGYAALSKGIPSSCNNPTVVNTVEVPYFELKEDPSFWMEHNVQVLIRVRPLNSMEKSSFGYSRCLKQESAQTITWVGQPETRFMFDHVACEGVDQEMLFRMVGLPMVENCLSGYNSCMFAYGQTGSGKTYTMLGDIDDLEVNPSPNRGMTPRIFEFLFARIRAEEESRRDEQLKYNCKCSFLEIYNEQITDLLDPSSTNLMLREDMKKGVYVDNLSEYEVHNVGDILQLLTQGSANRKVAATNMNRESSRSHSVFTCVIESKWEKDSTTNFRFARLNLVDLAGSERQKTSGAEGERLKEAANINKSLSSLGNVIMVLVDIAHGKPRHVPYRDSRLTFLLQDSLGGNSKTMIIANVSPSICSGPETLNTLKFAQRAKLIQNNAIINEDSSGDVAVLKHQIKLLKEELSALKRERVNRSLMFSPGIDLETRNREIDDANGGAIEGVTRVSCKQLKSLESTLAGSLRREKMAESSVTQLEAEIELLNRLVSQREEETRCAKMMLKFREDKIQRMESLKGGLMSADDYLREENNALSEEIQLLRSGHHKNPEVTRFASENIKLLHQVERFQDFYEGGEREMLMNEVTELRNQLMFFVDGNSKNSNHLEAKVSNYNSENNLSHELQRTLTELEESKIKLNSFLEENAKLKREIEELNASSNKDITYGQEQDCSTEVIKESIVEVPFSTDETTMTTQRKKEGTVCGNLRKSVEDIMDLQLELDILKIILEEERTYHSEQEEIAKSLNKELQQSKEMTKSLSEELKTVKLVVEALECEQIRSINEIEDLRSTNVRFEEMLKKKELEISYLKDRASFKDLSSCKPLENDGSPLTVKLKKMHHSLEKAKRLNELYQNDLASEESHQEEMEEIRRQVEGETAEVIVCLQEELSALQNEVHESRMKELESNDKFAQLQKEMKIMLEEKENQLKTMNGEWDLIASEIEGILSDGNAALEQASDETDIISSSFNQKRSSISEQFGRLKQCIFEKEFMISELNQCMKDAVDRKDDVERMLMSLREAALVMTENHQQECSEKDREILSLTSTVAELHNLINHVEDQLRATSSCATAAFVIVNRLSELNSNYYSDLQDKELQIREFKEMIIKKDTDFRKELEASKECYAKLSHELSEERRCREALVVNLEKNEENKISEQVQDLCNGVSSLKLSMNKYEKESDKASNVSNCVSANDGWAGSKSLKYSTAAAAVERESAIDLLKKEIECAVKCLQELKAQMDRMQSEKDEILASEKCSRKRIESVMNQTVVLGDAMDSFEGVFELKTSAIDGKLRRMEETLQKSLDSWLQERELMEDEIDEARVVAAQKTIEASCILKKFEEVQDTVKEADIMINELMIANEALKLNARDSKAKEKDFNSERVNLMQEIQSLKLSNNLKEQNYETDFATMKKMILELESAISEVQTASVQEWKSIASDFLAMKSQIHNSAESVRKLLEGVWSEIIAKDCAVSVLHLCHMGILLETSNGLNAENGFLQNGLSDSNTVISELREHNLRSRRELETCRALKGKLLTDIKKGFDRVLSKVDETGEVTLKLSSFQEKINDLQFQEEIMLQRSNDIGSELATLMKELDLSNKQALASILDQERLLKEKDELLQYQEENFVLESLAKEFESLTLSSELKQICLLKADIENAFVITLENLKKEVVFNSLDAALILHDKEFKLEKLVEEFEVNESAIEASSSYITELRQQIQNLQNDIRLLERDLHQLQIVLERKDEELGRLSCVEREKESLQLHLNRYKAESEASARNSHNVVVENQRLQDNVSSLQNCIAKLEEDLSRARDEMINQELSQSAVQEELCFRIKDLEMQLGDVEALKKENISLRNNQSECLKAMNLRSLKSIPLAETVDKLSCNLLNVIEEKFVKVDDMFHKMDNEIERGCKFLDQFEEMENLAMQLDSEILFLQTQLLRKDDILEGLLFDMSLLQESASNSQDSKHEKDELIASLNALEKESELRSRELEQAANERRKLEAQLAEKAAEISALESDLIRVNERISSLSKENSELLAASHDAFDARNTMKKELTEAKIKIENLETEVAELEIALAKLDKTNDSLKSKLDTFDELEGKVVTLTKELELARAVAEENEGIALEAQEIAEMQKVHAEEKEAEVKLLERSIEELECTINVLEQKVDIVKGEAERQRLQREELELELLSVKEQMHKVGSNDSDVKRCLDEKEKSLHESLQRVQLLEKEIAARDAEMSQCKSHISELNLHAEAQASEYKQKFKALEAMLEQVKSEVPSSLTSSSNKIERNSSKPRGSGSPFKCIGLGLAQQIKSERDEELTAGRQRIEELEALAASRQKEIFMLKARLASTESMTHDVIRDLLGVKLNMKNYANLIDNQQLQSLMKEVEHHNVKSEVKEQEVVSLKQQINEFLKERKGWLEEIERKQAELMSALVALEKLRQHDQLLATENEMLKTDNTNQKKRVRELELEIKKLSGQQNIQQRIHHHAKIKEENNSLRCQNEELSNKLHKSETILSRVKEELAQFRAANGRSPYINFDEEQLLHKKLKENEEEKLQLAQKLLGLCTSVLRAAGITRPTSEISVSVAEEALQQMKNSVVSLEMELGDAKLKNRISDERIRLSELVPQTSATEALRVDEDGVERKRTTQTSFLSAFDR